MERQFSVQTLKTWAQASSLLVKTSSIPILEHILIDRGSVVLGSQDSTLEWRMEDADTVSEWNPVAIPARDLERIVKVFPEDGVVSIREDGTVRFGKSRFHLPTLPGNQYPVQGRQLPETWMTCQKADFDRFAPSLRRFAGVKDARIFLNGVHWALSGGKLRMESTDGHRAVRVEIPLHGNLDLGQESAPLDAILPTDALASWGKLLQTQNVDQFSFGMKNGLFWLQAGSLRLRLSPIDSRYPDMNPVMLTADKRPLVLHCGIGELQTALSVAEIALESDRTLLLDLEPEELCITGRSQEKMAESRLGASWSGSALRKAYDNKYLRSMVDSFREWEPEETEIELRMGQDDMDSCVVITPYGEMVVMPIRV